MTTEQTAALQQLKQDEKNLAEYTARLQEARDKNIALAFPLQSKVLYMSNYEGIVTGYDFPKLLVARSPESKSRPFHYSKVIPL